ncbi:MAG TPA: ABC transporter permease [Gemmataceae bacterium]|jgi:simple sugar transport system permease protein|nr:ABC transporter permease [Gemmataceae bacterium]
MNTRSLAETLTITLAALLTSLVIFCGFMYAYARVAPLDLVHWMYVGGFGTRFSWQNTLTRAAPLILTALCTALPARLGLVIIGGEGALALGGLAAVSVGLMMAGASAPLVMIGMAVAGMVAGGLLIGVAGALRYWRGVNATISSLLLTYIAIALFNFLVEGPMKDPASLNKPSTFPIAEDVMIGNMFGSQIHWGLGLGIIFCILAYILMEHTTFGFAARMAGGNVRAAQGAGLPVGRLILITCFLGGAAAGLAGMVEVGAVQRQANASLLANYGFIGILVSFIARHHPLGIIPAAILFGGLTASSGILQRRLSLSDASMLWFMGIIFVVILLFETAYGRLQMFRPRVLREAMV